MSAPRFVDLDHILALSRPVLDRFAALEPKPWDRRAVLLELVGELGSLAHQTQHWDGFKVGPSSTGKLADECSDVLFVVLRLAKEDGIVLPRKLAAERARADRATDLVLGMCACLGRIIGTQKATSAMLVEFLEYLVSLCEILGLDLVRAHEVEMRIATQFLKVAGKSFPRARRWRHPLATLRLWYLLRQRK